MRATLATIADAGVEAPAAIVVGDVAALDLAWFETPPLFGPLGGRHPRPRAGERAARPPRDARRRGRGAPRDRRSSRSSSECPTLGAYEWLVFTSANGVAAFFDRGLAPAGLDARALAGVRVAAIGPGTAAALAERGVRADLVPERFVAEVAARRVPAADDTGARRVLLARAEQARDVLPDRAGGARLRGRRACPCTGRSTAPPIPARSNGSGAAMSTRSRSRRRRRSRTSATCSAIVPDPQPLVASIGPVTSKTALERGLRVDVEADEHTIDGLVAALVSALTR